MRGNRSELAPGRKSLRCHVNCYCCCHCCCPFGMISIFSLSSSHDDAVTIVVELMTTFGCVLGLSDNILSSSSKNGVFLLCVAFPVFYVRLCISGMPLQECGGGFSRLLRRGLYIHRPLKSRQFLAIWVFFLVQDFNLSWTFSSRHFSSKTLVSRSSHVLPRTSFGAAILKQFSVARKLNYLLQVV